ncbi:U4/U6-U5 snRNP complex subunit prp31 [Coemansia sp. RSA 552]|nr:U4/U6-U5 snRNP complex subunit prp31 [Coemansia sp. RSA 552]
MAFDDDLIAELDELNDEAVDDAMDATDDEPGHGGGAPGSSSVEMTALGEASHTSGIDEDQEMLIGKIASGADSIYNIVGLGRSDELKVLVEHISKSQAIADRRVVGRVEDDPDYRLVLQANAMSARIAGEVLVVHRFLLDHYKARFPELETLVQNPVDYARTIKAIGSAEDITKVSLDSVLPSATRMVVTVTGSTTTGQPLSGEDQARVEEAADYILELTRVKQQIVEFIGTRMPLIAPNLTAVIGASTAAKLIVEAGGLTALSKIPACNIQVLGKTQQTATGFSALTTKRHVGIVYYSEAVRGVPEEFRGKMMRKLSAKCVLAARVDSQQGAPDGSLGAQFRSELDAQVEKLLEAAPMNAIKPLPVPDDGPKRRRGGQKARKAREPYMVTELQKQRDRLQFGKFQDEVVVMDEMAGAGMLGNAAGRVRATQINNRTKAKVAKKYEKYLKPPKPVVSGTASLAFTPAQGFELANPLANADAHRDKKTKTSHNQYFSSSTPFAGKRDSG